MIKKTGFLLLAFFIFMQSYSQKRVQLNNTKYYSSHSGLFNNQINCIIEDKYGFIWLGTVNGLVRFDGHNFKNYGSKKPSKDELSISNISNLFIYDSFLWVTGINLSRMNIETQKWETFDRIYSKDTFYNINESFNIFKDRRNQLWLSTPYLGLAKFNTRLNRFETIEFPNGTSSRYFDWIINLFESNTGEIIFSESSGLVVLKNDKIAKRIPWPFKQGRPYRTNSMHFEDNKIWVNIDEFGMYQYDFSSNQWTPTKIIRNGNSTLYRNWITPKFLGKIKNNGCYSIQQSELRLQFCSKENVFYYLDNATDTLRNVNVQYVARDGNAWIGTSEGLYKIPKNELYAIEKMDISNIINSYPTVSWDNKQEKYFLSKFYNVNFLYFLDKQKKVDSFPLNFPDLYPTQYFEFEDKIFLVGKYEIKFIKNNKAFNVEQVPLHYNRFVFYRSDVFKNYALFSGAINKVYVYNLKDETCSYISHSAKENASFQTIARFLPNGNILLLNLSTNYFEEYDINGNFRKKYILPADNNYIQDFCIDNKGMIWFYRSNSGIFEFNPNNGKIISYYNPNYFDILNCEKLIYDKDMHIWAFSREGLFMLNINTKISKRIDDRLNFKLDLTSADMVTYKKGEILFLNTGCIYIMKPGSIQVKSKPFVFLEDLKIMGKKSTQNIFNQSKIILQPGENMFELTFGAVNTSVDSKIVFSWKIAELNEQWIYQTSQSIICAGMKPGKYMLLIRAQSTDGIFDSVIREIEVVVKPKFYQTLWFDVSILLIIVVIIYFFIRLKVRNKLHFKKLEIEKELALEKERNRIARDMHDDLGAGLSKIKYISNMALSKSDSDGVRTLLMLNKQNSDDLVDRINDIIWTLNNKEDSLEALTIKMRSEFGQLLVDLGKNLLFNCPLELESITIGEFKMRNIFLATKEAVNNSIKHAKANDVFVDIGIENRELIILVRDCGVGFEVEKRKHIGNGMKNLEKRLIEIAGTVTIQSNSSGTVVRLTIPI